MIRSCLLPIEDLKVRRQENLDQYDDEDGFPTHPEDKFFQIKCNVQPISGFERQQMPEGDRNRETYNVWTETELEPDDVVFRKGLEYEVRTVEDWNQQSIGHFKARIVRRDVADA